jgi:hypothetical protein
MKGGVASMDATEAGRPIVLVLEGSSYWAEKFYVDLHPLVEFKYVGDLAAAANAFDDLGPHLDLVVVGDYLLYEQVSPIDLVVGMREDGYVGPIIVSGANTNAIEELLAIGCNQAVSKEEVVPTVLSVLREQGFALAS